MPSLGCKVCSLILKSSRFCEKPIAREAICVLGLVMCGIFVSFQLGNFYLGDKVWDCETRVHVRDDTGRILDEYEPQIRISNWPIEISAT